MKIFFLVLDDPLDEHILNCVLLYIQDSLQGASFSDYPSIPIPKNVCNPYEEHRIIQNELDHFINNQFESALHENETSQYGPFMNLRNCNELNG